MNPTSNNPPPFPGRETVAPPLPDTPPPAEPAVAAAVPAPLSSRFADYLSADPTARSRWMALALVAGSLLPIVLLFGPRFPELVRAWRQDEDTAHGFLILPLSILLTWWIGRRQGWPAERDPKTGLSWTGGGCLLHLMALGLRQPWLDFVGLTVVLYGLAITLGGRDWARSFRLPIALLLLLVPLPIIPPPVGSLILGLPGFLAAALAIGVLYRCLLPGRFLLVGAVLPVTLLANGLRLGLLAWIPESWGIMPPEVGLFVALAAGLGMLLALAPRLERETHEPPPPSPYLPEPFLPAGWANALCMVIACVTLCLVAQVGLRAALKLDGPGNGLHQPLASFPVALGPWSATNAAPGGEAPDLLPPLGAHFPDAADRLERTYILSKGSGGTAITCRLGIAYCAEGAGHDHNPFTCYQVPGVAEYFPGRARVWLDSQRAPLLRLCLQGQGSRNYIFSWRYTWRPAEDATKPLLPPPDQRRPRGPASLTIEVISRAATTEQLDQVAELLRVVDHEVQSYLPANAQFESAARIAR